MAKLKQLQRIGFEFIIDGKRYANAINFDGRVYRGDIKKKHRFIAEDIETVAALMTETMQAVITGKTALEVDIEEMDKEANHDQS